MIVVDTNVILRGVRSNAGASGAILKAMLAGQLAFAATPSLILEYEDVLKRPSSLEGLGIEAGMIDTILDAIASMAYETHPWFRFRPFLDDPKDDLIIECAWRQVLVLSSPTTGISGIRMLRHSGLLPGLQPISSASSAWKGPRNEPASRSLAR
ncbi:PIN domain-containing protein [Antarcticirhabdus aurantiaca]|uniref:PIN domain-containing protein n=1 Tax=Antarcticirhabdus aurantiaca TaxID=2606717 RepID=UPI0018EF111B|nr:PIN domain-containing protein [Antarcticirhabdus aurantiaca]